MLVSVLLYSIFLAGASIALPVDDLVERQATGTCSIASNIPPATYSPLPNPFQFANGANITTKADFNCRAQEISKIMQQYELGDFSGPADTVKGTLSGNTLTVTVTVGGKSASYTASISKPAGNGPFPAIITIGGSSIPIPAGVATINFGNDAFAAQNGASSHGQGTFFTLFGANHSAGALTAWAWGVDRLIDVSETGKQFLSLGPDLANLGTLRLQALEQVNATSGIDTTRLGVTGCSRNGKGAFIVGALVKRIVLTIPQESGSGGAAVSTYSTLYLKLLCLISLFTYIPRIFCSTWLPFTDTRLQSWRISDSQHRAGANIQTASEIVGENAWFSPRFNSYVNVTTTIPEDHHMLAALIVPRGLFVIENDIDWLGPVSTTGAMKAGRLIYKGYGVPNNMGFSLVGGHAHCAFPSAQQTDLNTYINYFLLKSTTAPGSIEVSSSTVDMTQWAPWTVPALN